MTFIGGGDSGLSLTGLRIGPIDPVTKAAKIGLKAEVVKPDHSMGAHNTRILKERIGFSGGFKIPEEFRKSKQKKKGLLDHKDQEEDLEATQQSAITKDEIFTQLNLGHSEAGIGIGRHGTNSKAALAKDLVEGIEKDLEKLRRQQENLQLRKTLALNGGQSIVEETNEEKEREKAFRLKQELENVGAYVIDASPKKILAMRHQASQLASTKNLDLDQLEQMRYENERRLKELEEMYLSKRQNAGVGKIMREKMGFASKGSTSGSPKNRQQEDFDRDQDDDYEEDRKLTQSQKKKKSVRIVDEKENVFENNHAKQTSHFGKSTGSKRESRQAEVDHHQGSHSKNRTKSFKSPSRSQSAKRKKSESPVHYDSPRRKLYEAKFEKYIANKEVKHRQDKKLSNLQKEDFDRYTKGPDSPAKSSKRFDRSGSRHHYDEDDLIPKDYDEKLMVKKQLEDQKKLQSLKKDKFRQLNVSNEDKMTFFLLKWVFNAIKRDSEIEDPKLKGKSYVTKSDLVKQLSKNDELMQALGYSSSQEVTDGIRHSRSTKEGLLVWEEFLDFFFGRQSKIAGHGDNADAWWRKIGQSDQKDQSAREQDQHQDDKHSTSKQQQPPRYGGQNQEGKTLQKIPFYEDPDKKPVKMTESLRHLQDIRAHKTTQEVEDEFRTLQDKKIAEQKNLQNKTLSPSKKASSKKGALLPSYDYELDEEDALQEQLGIKREKSKCLLLQSQIFIMQEIYDHLDKYKDKILRRSDFLMALRTDERVVEFIDQDAVQLPNNSKKILTLDDVLAEIEKDEMYEIAQMGKNNQAINHKEFVTWREFMGYFNDYKDIEDRNRKVKELQKTRQSLQKERALNAQNDQDQQPDLNSLMEKEKQRRLQELPKLRPADQIDISEKQLQLLRDVFDLMPKVQNNNGQGDMINTIDFFIATRKNPQLRSLNSAIARDPDGYSRIPRETFQQVFDRMENEIQSKQLEWGTIVEYFTKRGRPLTKEEVQKLIDDDRQQREAEIAKKRADEDAERRRMARLMEDLEDKEDFEEFEMRQKSEQAVKKMQDSEFQRNITSEDDRDESDDEIDRDQDEDSDYEHGQGRGGRRRQGRHQDDESNDQDSDQGYQSDPEMRTAKRNYKFGDNGHQKNLSHSRRAQSAKRAGGKTFDERNIRNTKLTTRDYIDHDRSQSQKKKGKYGVTVPKPFGFDVRDKTKHKSIRERKVDEMVAEKKIKEENILKHQFRSNPIPPEVLIPRYKSIIEANEMRRLEVKKNSMVITKQKEQPFSFYERDKNKQMIDPEDHLPYDLKKPHFKANPIPRACSVLIFDQMMKKQEQEREERIRKQAELNFSKAKLPDRMQMHQEKVKQEQGSKSQKMLADMAHSFKPKINELVTREQFEKQQHKFNQKLNKKKSQMQVTRPKSPNFTKKGSKNLDREYLNEGESAQVAAMDKFKSALGKSLAQGKSQYGATSQADKAPENPSSTISMKLGMEKRREELEAKRKKEADKKQEDKDRLERQNRLKNVVQASLKDQIKDDKEIRQQQFEKKKQEMRDAEKEQIQKKKEILERVKGRPLLVERLYSGKNNSNLAKIKATEEYMKILKQNNLDPNDHLTEDQKDLLSEAQFIEKRKQQLGKY